VTDHSGSLFARPRPAAAIAEGRSDLFSSASGVGKKTAERIVLELKNKVSSEKSGEVVLKMEVDKDLIETLVGLGYGREEGKRAFSGFLFLRHKNGSRACKCHP
jgi:Holliday junction resolvasome RuvABC DNA-binding subunit